MTPHMYPDTLDGIDVRSPAERLLFEAFKNQLSKDFNVLYSVAWIDIRRRGTKPSDGEIDFVILHPRMGILLLEVKGGIVGRDENGNWISIRKDKSQVDIKNPFEQVKENKYAFIKKIGSLPNWQYQLPTIGHAVAFPDGTIDDNLDFGADIPGEIVLLHQDLGNIEEWLKGCLKYWAGEKFTPPGEQGVEILRDLFRKSWYLREPHLGEEIGIEHILLEKYTEEQFALLDWLAGRSRSAIRGCAGSGKTYLALKKAEQLANEGFRTLLTCFNNNLAENLKTLTGKQPRIKVRTFHGLCQEYAIRTGRNQKPDWDDSRPDFFQTIMPDALYEAAITDQEEYRFDAIIVDEGQDFSETWWTALEMLLADPENGVFYIFYDDNQLVYNRTMHLPVQEAPFPLTINCRNTRKIHEASSKYYQSDLKIKCKGPEGRDVGINIYDDSMVTLGAKLTEILTRMVYEHNVANTDIVILSPGGLNTPPLSRIKNAGAFKLVPNVPVLSNEIQCTTIRLFKGLEKPVVILIEPSNKDQSFTELMYVGTSRAVNHLELLSGPEK